MKLLFNDSLIMGKAFNTGYTEPDWQVQAADTRYSTGHAGYYTYYSRAEFYSTNTTQT
ncbi:hypothetical protein HYY72_02020 [Candidatus Woesearchaeota archaeon]|nr:hypothetical protein [Candidatus Woesearchaeota archaeon]